MEKIRAFIVDVDENCVKLLRHYLDTYCSFVEVVGSENTKAAAIAAIDKLQPQLLFLDIVLDEGTSFDILEEVSHKKTKIIFVTAYNNYAVKAFKYHATDYLLKPIEIEALVSAVNVTYKELEKEQFTNEAQVSMLYNSINNHVPLDFIAVPSIDKIDFIKFDEIVYFKSDGRYTEFHLTNNKTITATKNLGEYEQIIDKNIFFRTHNSYIINLKHVSNINKAAGNYCEMSNGDMLPIAKRRQDQLHRFIGLR